MARMSEAIAAAAPSVPSAPFLLAQECFERGHRFLVGCEVACDLLVEMRRPDIELVRGSILADKVGDLMHLRHPSIRLRRHLRQIALEPGQHLRLAAVKL